MRHARVPELRDVGFVIEFFEVRSRAAHITLAVFEHFCARNWITVKREQISTDDYTQN